MVIKDEYVPGVCAKHSIENTFYREKVLWNVSTTMHTLYGTGCGDTNTQKERERERESARERARARARVRAGALSWLRGDYSSAHCRVQKKTKKKYEEGEVTLHIDEYTIKHTIKKKVTSTTFPNARSIRLRALGGGGPPGGGGPLGGGPPPPPPPPPPPNPPPPPPPPRPRTAATKKRRLSVRSSVLTGARPHGQYRSCRPSDSYLGPVNVQVMLIIFNVTIISYVNYNFLCKQ
jgi:hypothetical protein